MARTVTQILVVLAVLALVYGGLWLGAEHWMANTVNPKIAECQQVLELSEKQCRWLVLESRP